MPQDRRDCTSIGHREHLAGPEETEIPVAEGHDGRKSGVTGGMAPQCRRVRA